MDRTALLFVCLGNICGSPLADPYCGDDAGFDVTAGAQGLIAMLRVQSSG